ncbi:hypothetical protein KM513_gp5 [Wuhan sharpbelly bornavirus]|uniref:Uncharacterized protein n=1 Tax=Wuhan sharpbelly bornavirus TaxID=2116489 RepID=A0A2P1GNK3_9MONO|nr:hypothetical protein KM513_gp5 [Wuhan sharpbelly bornavirus]AVM87540.1 hypothetical protein [Wuhan sharpbelly bornavirus]DBA13194.1 TPA_asm: matrix protein [Wuhan sharpbelly bornavirus]
MKMAGKYPTVDPEKSIVQGYHSLLLHVEFRDSKQFMKFALTSTTTTFHVPRTTAVLTIDFEPANQEDVWMYYEWEPTTYSSLKLILPKPGQFPISGKIRLSGEAGQHALRCDFNVADYRIISVPPGPLMHRVVR